MLEGTHQQDPDNPKVNLKVDDLITNYNHITRLMKVAPPSDPSQEIDPSKLRYLDPKHSAQINQINERIKNKSSSQDKSVVNIENYNQLRYQFQTHQLPQIRPNQSYQQQQMSSTQEKQVNQTNLHFGQPSQDMADSSYKFYQKNVYSSR